MHHALTYFILKDNWLHRPGMKEGQLDRRVVCDYDAAQVIELMHTEIGHAGNSKTYRIVHEIATQMKNKGEQVVMMMRAASRVPLCTKTRKACGHNVEVGGRILRREFSKSNGPQHL